MLYRKATQLPAMLARLFVMLFQSLKVVIEHSCMTDQAHLFRISYVARSDNSTTPRADDIKRRLEVSKFVGLRIYVSTHA